MLGGQTVAYQYDSVGRRIGSLLPNGIQCRQQFDERNRLIYLNYNQGSRPLLTYKYGHNQLGQRIVEEKTSAEQCKLTRYTFNARRELIASDRRVGNGCGVRNEYRYDLNHNRIGQNQFRYQYNGADQMQAYPGPGGSKAIAYNPQGQTTQLGDLTLAYNQSQQIKEAQSNSGFSRYEYDASGRRVAKEVNGEREEYLLLGQAVLKTFDRFGGVKADYFLGLGREGIKTDGNWKYYLSDGLGSIALLTDGSGNTVAAYDYEDYGATTQIAGSADVYNPYRYTGQEWDAELGMYNLRARHYSPSLGRFLARDPIGYAGGTNPFAYCQGDPTDFVDPTGLKITTFNIFLGDIQLPDLFRSQIKKRLEGTFSCTGFNVESGTGSTGISGTTYGHQFKMLDELKIIDLGGAASELLIANSDPDIAGSASTLFYKKSFEMFLGQHADAAKLLGQYYNLSNTILHELGHIILGVSHGGGTFDLGVMDLDWVWGPNATASFTQLGYYSHELISQGIERLQSGNLVPPH